MSPNATHPIDPARLTRLREACSLSLNGLASRARISAKTLQRLMDGGRGRPDTLGRIARALNVPVEEIKPGPVAAPAAARFRMTITVTGSARHPEALGYAAQVTPQLREALRAIGLEVGGLESCLALTQSYGTEPTRMLVLLHGIADRRRRHGSEPRQDFWVFAAIRPEQYEPLLQALRRDAVDFEHFGRYGDVILTGPGPGPDAAMQAQIAAEYRADVLQVRAPRPGA